MTDRAGGRIPSIRTSVHQRSLSRSSNASGSVPSSPKTHEFIHLDEELASKPSESPLGGGSVAEADPEVVTNGVEEPVATDLAIADVAVRGTKYSLPVLPYLFTRNQLVPQRRPT